MPNEFSSSDSDSSDSYDSSDSDYTHSSDSDYEPVSADESDESPTGPIDMGAKAHILFPSNHLFDKSGNVEEIKKDDVKPNTLVLFLSPRHTRERNVYQLLAKNKHVYAIIDPNIVTPRLVFLSTPPQLYSGKMNLVPLRVWFNRQSAERKDVYINKLQSILSRERYGMKQKKFFDKTDAVIELTGTSIDELKKPSLVMFFAPWCGHCMQAKPMYKQTSLLLDKQNIKSYALNCDTYGDAANKYGVEGFPTFGMVSNGSVNIYDGDRDSKSLVAWVTNSKKFSGEKKKEKSFFENGNVVELDNESIDTVNGPVMFFAPWCGPCNRAKPVYEDVSLKTDAPCYAINCDTHKETAQRYGVRSFPTFSKVNQGEMVDTFNGARNVDELVTWVDGPESGSELELTPERINEVKDGSVVLFYSPHCGHCVHFKPIYLKVAKSEPNMYLVNCDVYPSLSSQFIDIQHEPFNVPGYPTTVKIEHGMVVNTLSGNVGESELRNWMKM